MSEQAFYGILAPDIHDAIFMKNFKHFSFLSLALVTLVGAGCTASTTADVTTNTPTDTNTNTETANNTTVDTSADAATDPETSSTNSSTAPTTEDSSVYADGTYSATGSYTSPGGKETLPVTLTLENDVIVAVSVETPATNPMSQKFQTILQTTSKPWL